jgi:hypothetical protein
MAGEARQSILPDRQHDVIVLDQKVVGRIEADPGEPLAAPERDRVEIRIWCGLINHR